MTTYRPVTEQECDRLLALCEQKDLEIAKLQRAVEWCLEVGAKQTPRHGIHRICTISGAAVPLDVPVSIAEIIKPRESGDAHQEPK